MSPASPSRIDRVLVAVLVFALAWMFQIHLRFTHVDYNTFHEAGTAVLRGDWTTLYSSERGAMGGFLYPLGAAQFFALFAALGEWSGRLAFYLLLAGCLIWTFRWCASELGGSRKIDSRVLWITLLLGSRSINDSWISGNISLLLLAMTVTAYQLRATSHSDRPHASAALVGIATSFKIFPAALGIFWLWRRDFRQILRLATWTAAMILLPYLSLSAWQGSVDSSVDLLLRWVGSLRDPGNFGSHEMIHFQNLSAAFHRISSAFGWSQGWVMPTLVMTMAVIAIVPTFTRYRFDRLPGARDYAIILAWIPLLSPVTWHHLGVFYLPLIYITAMEGEDRGRPWCSLPLWSFFLLYTLTGKNVVGTELHAWISNHSVPLLGVLALVLPATAKVFRSTT